MSSWLIEQRKGKLATQMRQCLLEAGLPVQVKDQLGIAFRLKPRPARRQARSQALVVVELSVSGQHQLAVRC